MRTTRLPYLEYYVSLLQIWFMEHIIAYRPLVTKGLLQEDLIKAHLKRMTSNSFGSREDWTTYLDTLYSEQICWKPSWLHIGKVIIRGIEGGPLLLLGFRGTKEYSPLKVIRQYKWAAVPQALISHMNNSSGTNPANQK